ncbi:hypothetical protein EVAR_50771_1 [Eumeta japonica]|uniref:Uncharacterized protein n=1 Tax=Eumeta variegata TaxID=151549 RepID=A0A4C1WVW8_EUMVA|nr:hypothetical protein EVAR_50771_1 [Eumeta japonica]
MNSRVVLDAAMALEYLDSRVKRTSRESRSLHAFYARLRKRVSASGRDIRSSSILGTRECQHASALARKTPHLDRLLSAHAIQLIKEGERVGSVNGNRKAGKSKCLKGILLQVESWSQASL